MDAILTGADAPSLSHAAQRSASHTKDTGVHEHVFTTHLVRAIPRRAPVPVRLIVGNEQRLLEVDRPKSFNEWTLISTEGRAKRTTGLGPPGLRTLAKHVVSRFAPAVRTGYFFDTRFVEPNNVSHLLIETIPLCLRIREAVDDVTFVFHPVRQRFRELLAYFDIDPLCTFRPVRGRELTFRVARGLAQYEIGTSFDAPIYSYTGEVYSRYVTKRQGSSRVFLSRRGPRSLLNATEVNAMLEAHGFDVLFLEDYSIPQQIAIMQAADDVVAIHGAALAYLALKRSTQSVIEILPPNVYHDHFPNAVGHKVERYVQLIPYFDDAVQFAGWSAIHRHKQQPFALDLDQLRLALRTAGI